MDAKFLSERTFREFCFEVVEIPFLFVREMDELEETPRGLEVTLEPFLSDWLETRGFGIPLPGSLLLGLIAERPKKG